MPHSIFVFFLCLRYCILVMAKLLSHNFKMPAWPLPVCLRLKLFTVQELQLTHYRTLLYVLYTHTVYQYTHVYAIFVVEYVCWCVWRVRIHQRWFSASCDNMILYMQTYIHIYCRYTLFLCFSYRDTHWRMIAGSFSSFLTPLIAFTHSSLSKWKAIMMWGKTGKRAAEARPLWRDLWYIWISDRRPNCPHRTRSKHEHLHWLCLLLTL